MDGGAKTKVKEESVKEKILEVAKKFSQIRNEWNFFNFAEYVGRVREKTTDDEFEVFAEVVGRFARKSACQDVNEIDSGSEVKFLFNDDLVLEKVQNDLLSLKKLDELLKKVEELKNEKQEERQDRRVQNQLSVLERELDKFATKLKVLSMTSEDDRVRYKKYLVLKDWNFKKVGKINEIDLDQTDLSDVVKRILDVYDVWRFKDLIKLMGEVYEVANEEEFKIFAKMINWCVHTNESGFIRFDVRACFDESYLEKEKFFWLETSTQVLGSLLEKLKVKSLNFDSKVKNSFDLKANCVTIKSYVK